MLCRRQTLVVTMVTTMVMVHCTVRGQRRRGRTVAVIAHAAVLLADVLLVELLVLLVLVLLQLLLMHSGLVLLMGDQMVATVRREVMVMRVMVLRQRTEGGSGRCGRSSCSSGSRGRRGRRVMVQRIESGAGRCAGTVIAGGGRAVGEIAAEREAVRIEEAG